MIWLYQHQMDAVPLMQWQWHLLSTLMEIYIQGVLPQGLWAFLYHGLSKPDAFNLQLTDKTVPMEHYSGPGYVIPPCPQVMEFEGQTVEEALKLEEATRKDASYLCQLKTAAALEWSGFNSKYKRACDQHTIPKPKTFHVYGPLIDARLLLILIQSRQQWHISRKPSKVNLAYRGDRTTVPSLLVRVLYRATTEQSKRSVEYPVIFNAPWPQSDLVILVRMLEL